MSERELLQAVLNCETHHDERGHAYLKVPARSLNDLAALIAEALGLHEKSVHPELGSGALREALEAVINERDTELDMMRCEYPRGTPENKAWHDGVFAVWERLKIVKADAKRALSLSSPIEPALWPCLACGGEAGHREGCLGDLHIREQIARTPQASSEIREAAGDTLWQRCLSLVERCREKTPDKWDFAHELAEICKEFAATRSVPVGEQQ